MLSRFVQHYPIERVYCAVSLHEVWQNPAGLYSVNEWVQE